GRSRCIEVLFLFFFFFQAEDGIRDWSVTGVQTCALPILHESRQQAEQHQTEAEDVAAGVDKVAFKARLLGTHVDRRADATRAARSEERRVGKEGRAGGATED